MAAQVSDFDRFSFTLFMALAFHAVLVLGITFAPEDPKSSSQTMEITLSQFEDEMDPEDADFLAQTSQQGSGSQEESREMTTPQPAELQQQEIREIQPEERSQTQPVPREERTLVQTRADSREDPLREREAEQPPEHDLPVREKKSLMERSLEIASLEARFEQQRQAYAKKPRVMRVTAASTLRSSNAWYVQNWVSKVTRVGNINYSTEARRAGIYGTLRLLVAMRKDGTVKEITVLESSGSTILDDAAVRIVRMAAPFAPFPDELREQADELEIIRTWSFQQKGLTSG